jgi:hypothetical protein
VRAFKQPFHLAEHVKITDANLTDGLLTIDLVRDMPRRIEVGQKAVEAKPQQVRSLRAADSNDHSGLDCTKPGTVPCKQPRHDGGRPSGSAPVA